jgi:cytochrome-b5 reductase
MVKQYFEGKSSTYLHSLVPGESLFFVTVLKGYPWTPKKYSHITLIAGGAGITPIFQLIQGVLRNPEDSTKITLVFGVNCDADVTKYTSFSWGRRFSTPLALACIYLGSRSCKSYISGPVYVHALAFKPFCVYTLLARSLESVLVYCTIK